jgi:hypothetical protein
VWGKSRVDRQSPGVLSGAGPAPAPAASASLDSYGAKLVVVLVAAFALYNAGFEYIGAQTFRIGSAVYHVTLDDVMITLRVASNIAAGYGPYFNPGEYVAANTSLGWPFLLAIPRLVLGLSQTVIAVCVVSLLMTVLTIAAVALASRTLATAALTAAVIVTSPSVAHYSWSGWEHVPQMLLVTAALLILAGRLPALQDDGARLRAAVLILGVAFLIRPDTLPLLAAPGLVLAHRYWRLRDRRDLQALAIAASLCALYYLAHLYFYGSLVPNTFYLKVSSDGSALRNGIAYLVRNITDGGNTLVILLAIICLFMRRASSSRDLVIGAGLLLYVLSIVAVGGDYFSRGRFLLCITPIAVFIIFDCLWDVAGTTTAKIVKSGLLLAVVTLVPLHSGWRDLVIRSEGAPQSQLAHRAGLPVRQIGAHLALIPVIRQSVTPSDGQIGLFFLGTLSYYLPEYQFADFLGKADPVVAQSPAKWGPIAHNKWDIEHTLTMRRVSVVPLEPMTQRQAEDIVNQRRDYAGEASLVLHPLTQAGYRYVPASALGLEQGMGLLVREDLVARVRAAALASGTRAPAR